ncbi:RAV1 [[Candida] subhashii]|uniref:RAV1 n=1 Tax=[Candida] subhashii TaxID=561895 RepID=A0A8J5QGN3_9ASCO|nr:RAV1 [[Candida] subhashii]KAG7661839.1 RAV1 [[Candida] subhashii]
MTITFVPGEVNKTPYSVGQGNWKNHHILVYGSGNNLIITGATVLESNKNPNPDNIDKNLQTIYLDRDPYAIDVNDSNGFIMISIESRIVIFKPVNEYMKIPKWQQAMEFEVEDKQSVNCIKWAICENEFVVATDKTLYLYHLYDEYGELKINKRWESAEANPVTSIDITSNGSKIFTTSGAYDRIIKVWTRINYGNENTLFEVAYLQHPNHSYVTKFHWRIRSADQCSPGNSKHKRRITDAAMANIKNIRGYLNLENEDDSSDIIYSFTNDFKFHVWASYEVNGHNHIRNWMTLDLSECFPNIYTIVIIENYFLKSSLMQQLKKLHNSGVFEGLNLDDLDLLLVISETGDIKCFAITNISQYPPSNIQFKPLNHHVSYKFSENSFPFGSFDIHKSKYQAEVITKELIQSQEYITDVLHPVLMKDVTVLNNDPRIHALSIIIHDRIKNTIRFNTIDFRKLLDPTKDSGIILLSKFQGHTKSIRKVVKSNSSFTNNNILLSISNFPEHNYIWEAMLLTENKYHLMSVTKRFQLNVDHLNCGDITPSKKGISSAAIINDVEPPIGNKRRHIVVSIERDGHLSVWDCNGSTNDDQPADLVLRQDIDLADKFSEPRAFILTEFPDNSTSLKQYCIFAVFENDIVKAWRLSLSYSKSNFITKIGFNSQNIAGLPQDEKIFQIGTVDAFIQDSTKSLVTVIDENGLLRCYTLDYSNTETLQWKLTHSLVTNIKRASKIHGSTIINKFAVVDETGSVLTVWDVNQGVLEYEETFPEENGPVKDLDWTFISASTEKSTSNAILSIGFSRFVLLYTQLRYDYTNKIPTFACLKKIDISDYTSHEIGDSIWLDGGYLIIGSGNQFFIDDRWVKLGSRTIDSMIRQLMTGYSTEGRSWKQPSMFGVDDESDSDEVVDSEVEEEDDGGGYKTVTKPMEEMVYDISQLVRVLNGPLPIYHPQFLIQGLFMSQVNSVKKILVKLFHDLRNGEAITWDLNMNIEEEIHSTSGISIKEDAPKAKGALQRRMSQLFSIDVFSKFNDEMADLLTENLMKISLPLLTRHQQSTLISVVAIVKELTKHLPSLDDNGIRFMIGFKLFQLSTKQTKLSMRDINWALHSDNKEMLLAAVEDHYKHRMTWESIRQTGLAYWIKTDRLIKIIENAARNEFSENRDPSGRVSLFYLALHKKQILIGLWRTVSHQEQQKMLKFLSNDFTQTRWKSAALKNAFVLLGKHRFMDAAYFFLLGDAPADCCSTLASRVGDVALAIAIAKVYSGTAKPHDENDKQSLITVIENYILPKAVLNGDRWTTSWMFWQMGSKELSIQALIRSPLDIVMQNRDQFSERSVQHLNVSTKGQSFLRDDPVLILLFNDLRQRKINYFKGSLDISKYEEFQFIVKVCLIYTRMGCDYLALLLLRTWSFSETEIAESIDWGSPISPTGKEKMDEYFTGTSNGGVPNLLNSFSFDQPSKKKKQLPQIAAKMKQQASMKNKTPPPAQAFEEPDMSAFSFGF